MKLLLVLSGICVALLSMGTRAEAQNYPWCAYYSSGDDGGGTNCGFITFEQCMATARGLGSNCQPNTQTCLHRDRIRRRGFKGVITERAFVELAPAPWRYSPRSAAPRLW